MTDKNVSREAVSIERMRRDAEVVKESLPSGYLAAHRVADYLLCLLASPVQSEERLRIEDHWLAREVGYHTCGTAVGGYYGAHEPGCGLEPELDLSTLPGWRSEAEIKAEALREAADGIQALHPGETKASVAWLRDRAGQIAEPDNKEN